MARLAPRPFVEEVLNELAAGRKEGRMDDCSSRNTPDFLLVFAPSSTCSNAHRLTSKSTVLTCFLHLGLGASDIMEKLHDWRENKKHSDFPHFCIWFPCQWLSREMLIPLRPVLHGCAGAGCTPAHWRKYYSFYPFPEGKSFRGPFNYCRLLWLKFVL